MRLPPIMGRDVEELFSQIQADKEMAERYGLKIAFEPFGGLSSFGQKLPEDVAEAEVTGGNDAD